MSYQPSEKLLTLIKEFEGCRLTAYQDTRGIWTIGYGHTTDVQPGQTITQTQADDLLANDVSRVYIIIGDKLPKGLTDNQVEACISLAFNIGPSAFLGSHVFKYLQEDDLDLAADCFLMWVRNHDGSLNTGLLHRRQKERDLFLTL